MGHTLVTRFDENSIKMLHTIMSPFDANKIPFGRNCDREAADAEMDYHLTVLHWPKSQDWRYLELIKDLVPMPCQILVTGTRIMWAEEGSRLLYFTVNPTREFLEMTRYIEKKTNTRTSDFLHITLAVSKDPQETEMINSHICNNVKFPFLLNTEGLDLYHIWTPTKKTRSF